MCLCVCPCHRGNHSFRWTGDFWSKCVSQILAYLYHFWVFAISQIFRVSNFWGGFGSLQTNLLFIMVELAGGRSVAVAVGVIYRWQVAHDILHVTHDTWHLTPDTWHLKPDIFSSSFFSVRFCLFLYRCYYRHTLRYSVSPVCKIFFFRFDLTMISYLAAVRLKDCTQSVKKKQQKGLATCYIQLLKISFNSEPFKRRRPFS